MSLFPRNAVPVYFSPGFFASTPFSIVWISEMRILSQTRLAGAEVEFGEHTNLGVCLAHLISAWPSLCAQIKLDRSSTSKIQLGLQRTRRNLFQGFGVSSGGEAPILI